MSWLIWLVVLFATPWLFFYVLWKIKFSRRSKATIPILAYHQVSGKFDWSITRQKPDQFERGMRFLHEQGYRTVGLDEALSPDCRHDEKEVVLTFDDAYQEIYSNAFPILRRLGFTAWIFVITGYVGKYSRWDYHWGRGRRIHLTWEQIQEMADAGFGFGSHTVNHPDLTKIPRRHVEYELKKSKETLQDKLNRRVDFLSYPFGRHNRYVQKEAHRLGYAGALTLRSKPEGEGMHAFSVSRWGVYLLDSPLTLRVKVSRGKLVWIEDMKARIINCFPSWTVALKGSPRYGQREIGSEVDQM